MDKTGKDMIFSARDPDTDIQDWHGAGRGPAGLLTHSLLDEPEPAPSKMNGSEV